MPDDALNPPAAPKRTPLHKVAYGLNAAWLSLLLLSVVLYLIHLATGSATLWTIANYQCNAAIAFGVLALVVEGVIGSREKAEALANEQSNEKAKDQA